MVVDAEYGHVVNRAASNRVCDVAIVGAGPAGLFAAEVIATRGHRVTIYERMPSPARKFLLAGRGGLNLTHSGGLAQFLDRYGDEAHAHDVRAAITDFAPEALIAWANGLGADTFVGTSGRVFPRAMKASPLLRAWLRRLDDLGVVIKTRHAWTGFALPGGLVFETAEGTALTITPDAAVFALGGASWPKLGADGSWVEAFEGAGISVAPLAPANCGILISWSEIFRARFEGAALKRIAICCEGRTERGEAIVTRGGLEGGVLYALNPAIRVALARDGMARLVVDLKPDISQAELAQRFAKSRGGDTATNFVRKAARLDAAAIGLLREGGDFPDAADALAQRIKELPLSVTGLAGLSRAISTAGGVAWRSLDRRSMLRNRPGFFVAGEMLDWDAPTGGYLLQGSFATAARAANGLLDWLSAQQQT